VDDADDADDVGELNAVQDVFHTKSNVLDDAVMCALDML